MQASLDEYDVFVPLTDNAGHKHSRRLLNSFKQKVIGRFGGLTDFNHRNKGHWSIGSITFQDSILLWRVLCPPTVSTRKFFLDLKREMQRRLGQKEILIIRRKVAVIK